MQQPLIVINLTKSTWLLIYFIFLHCGALLALTLTDITFSIKFLLATIVLGHAVQLYYRQGRFAIHKISYQKAGVWLLQDQHNIIYPAKLVGENFVTAPLMILQFRLIDTHKKIASIITADNSDQQQRRRLRVFLHVTKQQLLN